MNFEKDNSIKAVFTFNLKKKPVSIKLVHQNFNVFLNQKYKNFNYESSSIIEDKIYYIIKGLCNINIFLEAINNIQGGYINLKRKNLVYTPFFFDIKINNEILIYKLKCETNDIKISKMIDVFLNDDFKFYETLSNFIFIRKGYFIRLYFKDYIDYYHASLEFSNYTKTGKNYEYPEIINKNTDIIDVDKDYFGKYDEGGITKKFINPKYVNNVFKIEMKVEKEIPASKNEIPFVIPKKRKNKTNNTDEHQLKRRKGTIKFEVNNHNVELIPQNVKEKVKFNEDVIFLQELETLLNQFNMD